MDLIQSYFEIAALLLDVAGVIAIFSALFYSLYRFIRSRGSYHQFRSGFGRGILLGLEFLVAGDIIRTVAFRPNLRNVIVLGLIVLIRIFLSITLEAELRQSVFPWKKSPSSTSSSGA